MAQGQGHAKQPRGSVSEDGHLHALCKEGSYKKIEEFIQTYKADLPAKLVYRRGVFGYTPIHEAVSSDHSEVLKLLLEHKGNPNCRANSGYTPLHLAASSGHVNCVRVLLENDADISNRDEYGKTPMQTAELSSKQSVMKVLRSAGELQSIMFMIIIMVYTWYLTNKIIFVYVKEY